MGLSCQAAAEGNGEAARKCPGVSKETIKSVLKTYPECFVCEGRGVAARWLKIRNVGDGK